MSKTIKYIWGISLLCLMAVGCVQSSIYAGNIFVPEDQKMGTYVDSSMTLKTSIISVDSVSTSGSSIVYLGRYNSEIFGSTITSGMSTFFSYGFSDSIRKFGESPEADSMIMAIYFTTAVGDSEYPLNISVYSVTDTTLGSYSQYYSNRSMKGRYDPKPIVTFELQGTDTTVKVHLPESFYNSLLVDYNDTQNNMYSDDSVFFENFKGLYFEVNNPAPAGTEGRLVQLQLAYSYMTMYYRSLDEEGEIDTTFHDYVFYSSYVTLGNNYTVIERDYSTADVSVGGVDDSWIGDTTLSLPRLYVQGMGGIGAQLEVDTIRIEEIKQKALEQGYSNVVLHSARIQWGVESPNTTEQLTPQTYNMAPSRLGLYKDYQAFYFIPEYDAYSDILNGESYSLIGGNLNRSHGYYEQSIVSTMQNLFKKPQGEYYKDNADYNYIMELFPALNLIGNYSELVVGGGNSLYNAPQIVLVYTLVH